MEDQQNQASRSSKSLRIISGFFEVVWYLSWVAIGLSLALMVLVTVTDFRVRYMHLPIEVDYRNTEMAPEFGSEQSARSLPVKGFGDLVIDAREVPGQGYLMMIPATLALGLLWIVYQLRLFLRSVCRGTPFNRENPKILRRIGYTVAAGGPAVGAVNYIYGMVFIHAVDFPGATVGVTMDVYPFVMFLGLIILVIAQVFDYGVKLQTEQDLTV